MYQSLYRKYRPKNFNEVVGQDIVKKTLIHSILNNKISHAYLFTGPRGTGKTSVAKILAKTVNCTDIHEAIACEKCENCIQFNNKQSNDIIEIDAASNNGVDEIRELKNKINIVPSTGKYKIYIIDEVHMLTVGAFNALLKTLEEPPSHVIFVLATTEPHKIPSTILSRCQRFDFKKISTKQICEHLANIAKLESVDITEDSLYELARISDGGMRDAFSLFEQAISYGNAKIDLSVIHEINGTIPQEQLKELFTSLIEKNIQRIFEILEEYDLSGKNLIKIMDEFILFLRNIMLAHKVPEYLKSKVGDISLYIELSKRASVQQIIGYIDEFNRGMNEMKFSNNPRLNMELVFISLMDFSNKEDLSTKKVIEKKISTQSQKEEVIKATLAKTVVKQYDTDYLENLNKLIEIRVNNTLCNFDKKNYLIIKNKLQEVNQYILLPELSKPASIVLDGELKAANDNYFIFMYQYEDEKYDYYECIEDIDAMLSKLYSNTVHSIAVTVNEWNVIKNEFNTQKKKYEYKDENINIMSFLHKIESANEIEDSFGNLIQYN